MLPAFALLTALICQDTPPAGAGAPTQGEMQLSVIPFPEEVVLKRGDKAIAVDGFLNDWPGLPPIHLDDPRQLSGTFAGAYRGPQDIAAQAFLLWDEEHLYFAARVLDDWHAELGRDLQGFDAAPPADGLLLSFDPRRDSQRLDTDSGRRDDVVLWLGDVGKGERAVYRWDVLTDGVRSALGARLLVTRDDDQKFTGYEMRIPWREILPDGMEPEDGLCFDMQIVVNDLDEPTDPMPQTRIGWTFGSAPTIDPMRWGSVLLKDLSPEDLRGEVNKPLFPAPPETEEDSEGIPYWDDLALRLRESKPELVRSSGLTEPRMAGGPDRRALLRELDFRTGRFPRVDFVRFQQRMHRRMNRECLGIEAAGGLPYLWELVLDRLVEDVAAPAPERGFRIFRMQQGGWMVRSKWANFAIDPAGFDVEKRLWGGIDFALLTRPLAPHKRNDMLLVRMFSAVPARSVFTHIPLHLPAIASDKIPLCRIGQTIEMGELKITVLGAERDNVVSQGLGYHVAFPDGSTLVVSGMDLLEETVPREGGIDALLLSALHPAARVVAQRLKPRLTILDDVLVPRAFRGRGAYTELEAAYRLQESVLPYPSLLLAPGEQWDVVPGTR